MVTSTAGPPELSWRRLRSMWVGDALAVVILIVLSLAVASAATGHVMPRPDFYYLNPALGVATGRGFQQPVPIEGSRLQLFLRGDVASLDDRDLVAREWREPDHYIRGTRYLVYLLGWWWRLTEVSWAGVGVVAGLLHALTAVGSYALLRLWLPLPICFGGAVWMITSTLSLRLLPHLRDYSKGAFMLALLPLVVTLVLRAPGRVSMLVLSAAVGTLAAIGAGFKMDVAIMVPIAALGVAFFRGARPWSAWRDKAMALATMGAAFVIAGFPVWSSFSSEGSNAAHVILLGWSRVFDPALQVGRTPYDIVPFYNDGYVSMMVQALTGGSARVPFPSAAYDAASLAMFLRISETLPADVLARILAAANVATNLVFLNPDPTFFDRPVPGGQALASLYAGLSRLNGAGAWIGAVLVVVAAWSSVRIALFAAVMAILIGGYSFLQFSDRHYFHTQIVSIVIVCGMLGLLVRLFRGPFTLASGRAMRVALTVLFIGVGGVAALLAGARVYQASHLRNAIAEHVRASLTPVKFDISPAESGSVKVTWADVASGKTSPDGTRYLLEFSSSAGDVPIHVGLRYESAAPDLDYSRVLGLKPQSGINLIGFTALSMDGVSTFAGLELAAEDARQLSAIYVVDRAPANLPFDLALPAGWRAGAWYQRFWFEPVDPMLAPQVICAGRAGCSGALGVLRAAHDRRVPLQPAHVDRIFDDSVRVTTGALVISGTSPGESDYLVALHEWAGAAHGAVVFQGHLAQGRIVIGLLREGRWYQQTVVEQPGEFSVVLPVDGPGPFVPLVTNARAGGQRWNEVTIDHVAFIDRGRELQLAGVLTP